PTMGGLIIIMAIVVPTLLLARLDTVYIILMLVATVWLGVIGFIDDYLKLRAKKIAQQQGAAYKKGDKDGLAGWFKILGQVGLGITVGAVLYFNSEVRIWREYQGTPKAGDTTIITKIVNNREKHFVETKE
ncbi:MAG TPA: phospho-N-acetylmuramoyl-pentapeptide-transferase, partial [Chitinophagaceae bacterium]|nr:phospho-N-acetylmuramoyl-pentapeptide-transferase [Chitinophagaceae bacterium]